jgi:DNA-binding NtrC family response regulator
MDLELQKKLLRFVETNRFSQLGSDKVETVDIRLLSATNRHLPTEVKAGRFREDLYYRLKTIAIHLPPLRDRGDDVLFLAQKFLKEYTLQAGKYFQNFDIRAEKLFLHCKWPGNVRQLKNCVQSVVLMNEGNFVTSEMLIATLGDDISCEPDTITHIKRPYQDNPNNFVAIKSNNAFRSFKEIEKDIILAAIKESGGNMDGAANLLKMNSATIYRRKKQWQAEKN